MDQKGNEIPISVDFPRRSYKAYASMKAFGMHAVQQLLLLLQSLTS